MNFAKFVILSFIFSCRIALSAEPVVAGSGSTPPQSFSQSILEKWKKNGRASYLLWLTGPNSMAISGNKDGSGTNLSIAHYFAVGYKLGSKWSMTATQPMLQSIDENPDSKTINFTDPYVTFSNSRILNSARYGANLSGYIRYYIPVSRGTHDAVNSGSASDSGNGAVRIGLTPSKTFFDGALAFGIANLVHYRFNKNTQAERVAKRGALVRKDFYFLFSPNVSYSLNPSLDITLEYASGYLYHSTDGKFTKFNDPNNGQWISAGVNYFVDKKLAINPYLSWGPVFRGFKSTDIGLLLDYKFL